MPPAGHVCQRPLTDDVRVFLLLPPARLPRKHASRVKLQSPSPPEKQEEEEETCRICLQALVAEFCFVIWTGARDFFRV